MLYNLKKRRIQINNIQPFHIVDISAWPIVTSISLNNILIGIVAWLHNYKMGKITIIISLISLIYGIYRWSEDMIRESKDLGNQNKKVIKGLKIGYALFLITELVLFLSFIISYLISSGTYSINSSAFTWPSYKIEVLNPLEIPLLNTAILLISSMLSTSAHRVYKNNDKIRTLKLLLYTIILALIFTLTQIIEYYTCSYDISDGIFSSTFYSTTFLHGVHVFIGTILLIISYIRIYYNRTSSDKHLFFNCSVIYYHFVDFIWLLVFSFIYCGHFLIK